MRTTWRPAPAWGPGRVQPAGPDAQALRDLLLASIAARHDRVAVQRYMKLLACGAAVPTEARSHCEQVLRGMRASEAQRMARAARGWAELVAALRPAAASC